jgi:hypothetical protein
MTDDRHFRVFESGWVEDLPAPAMFYGYSADATEKEIAAAEAEYVERNRWIYNDLHARGLLPPPGSNLLEHEMNEVLRSGGSIDYDTE